MKLKVLIVDDSPLIRTLLRRALSFWPDLEIVGAANDGLSALGLITQLNVDVVILDVEMPTMDGREVLRELARRAISVDVIIFSGASGASIRRSIDLLSEGAFDVISKPKSRDDDSSDPVEKIKLALKPALEGVFAKRGRRVSTKPLMDSAKPSSPLPGIAPFSGAPDAVLIAASTGGPPALERLLREFPSTPPVPVFIVQHMPAGFTGPLAERLSKISHLDVVEAKSDESVVPGRVYLAPGGLHLEIVRGADFQTYTRTNLDPPVHFVRPSADVLFDSAARVYGRSLLTIVMTGMGEDGGPGAARIRALGGRVWIQDEASCVVYGMPGAVERTGASEFRGTPEELRERLIRYLSREAVRKSS